MSTNDPGPSNDGLELNGEQPYEDFEDLDIENATVASTEALLPSDKDKSPEYFNEETLKREIDKVEKLRIEEVRWFYQSGKKKRWKPFIGSDSIAIETEWRCISQSDREVQRVCVRGGMYEVDVLDKKCYPVYWSSVNLKGVEENVEIIRGTWFYESNFMPLDEEIADKIEQEHIERWKGCSLDEVKRMIGSVVMHSVKLNQSHVDWYSVNDVYVHSDAVSYRALRNIVQKFGASKTSTSGHKLHRGYREDAMHEDCMPSVEHLVFVVHGIGSKPDRHKIVRNTNELRLACERMSAKHYAHYTGRVEFLPVEWRSRLVLDDGIVETLMPRKSVGVRQFLNNSAMDIMYYTSPLYKAEIVNGLRDQISRLHGMFMQRNPDFQGKISILAHSLGSVIMHDIMTNWSPEVLLDNYIQKTMDKVNEGSTSQPEQLYGSNSIKMKEVKNDIRRLSQINKPKSLNFVVENFFCVGSPLGIFMALRGHRPSDGYGTQDDIIPRSVCRRIFNVYHPADPIAYRLEPLVLSHYITIAPLQIHANNSLQLTPYYEIPAKPFSAETSREMATLSVSPGYDNDVAAANGMENDEEQLLYENTETYEEKEFNEAAIHEKKCDSPDGGNSSPTSIHRPSYLRAISGSAVRVGKAIWGRARASSSPQATKCADGLSHDSSYVSEDDQDNFSDHVHSTDVVDNSTEDNKYAKQYETTSEPKKKVQPDVFPLDSTRLEYRLDYELQEGFTESRLGYASLTSHTSYWGNQDIALFVLMQIHPASTMTQSLRSRI